MMDAYDKVDAQTKNTGMPSPIKKISCSFSTPMILNLPAKKSKALKLSNGPKQCAQRVGTQHEPWKTTTQKNSKKHKENKNECKINTDHL